MRPTTDTLTAPKDAIDIRDIFAILKKHKLLIFSVTALTVLSALIYCLTTKPLYEAKGMVEIALIDKIPFEDVETLKQKLEYAYHVNTPEKKNKPPRISSVLLPKKSKNLFELKSVAYSDKDAAAMIETVLNKISTDNQDKIQAYQKSQNELIALNSKEVQQTENTISELQKELGELKHKFSSLKADEAPLAGAYGLQIEQKQDRIFALQNHSSSLQKNTEQLKLSLSPLMIKPVHIIGGIETLDYPIWPQTQLILVLSLISGLALALFLVMIIERLKGTRDKNISYT
jgi:uncharacterized protein involved in exopolysaccharide biosynthesis